MKSKKYVCNNAKIICPSCTNPNGKLIVTSNVVKLQDKFWATVKDNQKLNLQFSGNCTKSYQSSVPCAAIIAPGKWEDTGDILIQDNKALLECSTIVCNYGGATITIKDHAQKTEMSAIQPSNVDSLTPDEPISKTLASTQLKN